MSIFCFNISKIKCLCRVAVCHILFFAVIFSAFLPNETVCGQSLREKYAAYQQQQKAQQAQLPDAAVPANLSDHTQVTGQQQIDNQTQTQLPAQTPEQGPVQIASSHRPGVTLESTWPSAQPSMQQVPMTQLPEMPRQSPLGAFDHLRAAVQSPNVEHDEAIIRRALLSERQNDARLNDLCFVTPMIGWAVGDCGVIWHTQNGGQNWQMQESGTDAPLFGVDFIDVQNGFAVGGTTEPYSQRGRGVVLRTSNGGQTWERVTTFAFPVLYCIRIAEPGKAWVAGSASEQCPTGILRTSNNGQSWQVQPGAKNEGWASLAFRGPNVGAGIGLDGAIQVVRDKPALSRTPPLGLRRANAVDVFKPQSPVTQQIGLPSASVNMPTQTGSPYDGWLVGDGGVIMCSRNCGMAWEVPQGFLPIERPDLFDFQTVFARDTNIWLAGNPGTLIFYSNDCGATWHATPSGIATPIRKIRFITPQQGYAVGDLGVILATYDGGRSWQIQRAGGARLAVLGIFARMQDVPYEALSQVCLEEGYLGGVSVIFRQDSMRYDGREIPANKRLHEATVACGGTSTTQPWAFSIDHDELAGSVERVIERLEFENDGYGLARLRESLVATIRTWRPNVILAPGNVSNQADSPKQSLSDPARDVLQREILWAVQAAANPMMYPEQLTETGLRTWQVDKVHLCCNATVLHQKEDAEQHRRDASAACNLSLRSQTLAPRQGKTYDDIAQAARALFETEASPSAFVVPFRTVFDFAILQQNRNLADPQRMRDANRASLFGAISLPHGSEARRTVQGLSMLSRYDALQQLALRQGTARNVINSLGRGGQLADGNRILAQLDSLTQQLDRDTTVQTLLEMGNRLHRTGDWDAAAEVYLRIMRDNPTHDAAKTAYIWLLQYMTSFNEGERAGKFDVATNYQGAKFDRSEITRTTLNNGGNDFGDQLGIHAPNRFGNEKLNDWGKGGTKSYNQYDKALMLADFVGKVSPDVLNAPRVQFCLASAQRKNGNPGAAEGYYVKRSLPPNDDVWAVRAAAELWANGQSQSSIPNGNASRLPTIACRLTGERPFLDGKLDDDVWSQGKPTLFSKVGPTDNANAHSPNDQSNAESDRANTAQNQQATAARSYREQTSTKSQSLGSEAMFLYDNEFLYIGLRCRKSDGFAYHYQDFREIPRTHDPNLAREDRVELLLDQKRNYTTYDAFELDYRGWISESRWFDKNWNPRWFVARHEDETHWYVEAAIPLDQLTLEKPKPGSIWGIALRRLVPGVGVDAWNAKHSFNTNEGFGFLLFE